MRPIRRLSIAAALIIAALLGSASPASGLPFAQPIAAKRAEASAAQARVDALNDKAEMAAERYNEARGRFEELSAQEAETRAQIRRLDRRTVKLQGQVENRVGALYRQGPIGALSLLLSVDNIQQLVASYNALTQMSERDSVIIAQLKETKAEKSAAHKKLKAAVAEAKTQKQHMESAKRDVDSQLAAANTFVASLNADIRDLLHKQQLAEEAAARARAAALRARLAAEARAERARAAARRASASNDSNDSGDDGGDPPPSGRGAKAVYYAMKQLGKPYRWGADGPNSFDCSGLMMWAYRKVGVSLPHHSGSQIGRGSRVSRENLQPGDLVFFGSPIHHVGMYVGGGDFIEAPHTGAQVRIRSLSNRSDYVGASRP